MPSLTVRPSKRTDVSAKGERNEPLDALVRLAGMDPLVIPSTAKKTWKRFSRCLEQIKEVCPHVTVEQLRDAYRAHVRTWPTIKPVTPESLSKHFGQLMGPTLAVLPGNAIVEPAGWRDRHAEILPDADYGATGAYLASKPWPQIPTHIQQRIISRAKEFEGDGKIVRFPHAAG